MSYANRCRGSRAVLSFVFVVVFIVGSVETVRAVDIVWDGVDGPWNTILSLDSGNWNGGLDAIEVFGDFSGLVVDAPGLIGNDVFINSGNVTYAGSIWTDFVFRQLNGAGTFNLSGGATWTQVSESDRDGIWTRMDPAELNIDGPGTKLIRTFDPTSTSNSGGALIFGTWTIAGQTDPVVAINLTNGGGIENDGQVWFAAPNAPHAQNLQISMTINDGYLDLTGGDNERIGNNLNEIATTSDLVFSKIAGKDENYSINFTGPGSITVDHSGIVVVEESPQGISNGTENTLVTYPELWDLGILQANGLSGLDGKTFGNFFTVTGTSGSDNYLLTSLVGSGPTADFDGSTLVDGNDFLIWQRNFLLGGQTNNFNGDADGSGTVDSLDLAAWDNQFGGTLPLGSLAAEFASVPEPTSLSLVAVTLALVSVRRGRRRAVVLRV